MHDTWTDELGIAHFIKDVGGVTFCGLPVVLTTTHAVDGCRTCVDKSNQDYARSHRCGVTCRA